MTAPLYYLLFLSVMAFTLAFLTPRILTLLLPY